MDELRVNLVEEDTLSFNLTTEDELQVGMSNDEDSLLMQLLNDSYGVSRYASLPDKPSINGVTLENDKTFEELGREDIRNARIKEIIDTEYENIFGGN